MCSMFLADGTVSTDNLMTGLTIDFEGIVVFEANSGSCLSL